MKDLTIGIVTYNGQVLTAQCLKSIYDAPPACSFEIVVVDNASNDGTVEWLRETYPGVRPIANGCNLGVARGNNQCLALAGGRYVLLLNNDTLILPGALDRLVAFADAHPDAGAAGGRLINPDGSFQSSYVDFPRLWLEFLHVTRLWVLFDPSYPCHADSDRVPREVDWISSACLLVRSEAAQQIGGVDEAYFMYSDETDLQYRLRQAGWHVYYLPDVATVHFGGRSASHWRRRKLIYRGKLLFFQKHYGPGRTALLRLLFGSASAVKVVVWSAAWLVPGWRSIAGHEIRSNLDVLRLSLSPTLVLPTA